MPHHDPMHYSMEQLIKALANETIFEFVEDRPEEEEDFDKNQITKWGILANTLVSEINNIYSGNFLQPFGHYADICVNELESIVRAYSSSPWSNLLLDATNEAYSNDPNCSTYITIIVRAMDSDDAHTWKINNENGKDR